MHRISDRFDPDSVEWRRVVDSDSEDFKIDFEYSLLGYDLPSGRLDMLLRFAGNGGHCRRHRHVASTVTLVLEGEQHVDELQRDGTIKSIVRKAGDYALAGIDALPHLERGGPEGGTVLLSLQAPDGVLFEYFDKNMKNRRSLTIEQYVDSWDRGIVPGGRKAEAAQPSVWGGFSRIPS
ncbi:MAG: hypothetical protein GKS00_02215 [Alphaproteobacteria bacterium]|nr:hypothetical protein [Alphaproteobacteria bacterium]